MLRETEELIGEPEPITHPVKFFERVINHSKLSHHVSGTYEMVVVIRTWPRTRWQRR